MKKNILKKISIGLLSAAMMVSMTACNTKIKVTYDYKAEDYVTLGEYKGIEVSVDADAIENNLINTRIQNDLESNTTYVETTRAAQADDKVTIDFKGSIGGEQVSGFSDNDYSIVLGKDTFTVEGFVDELYGVKSGDVKVVTLTVPEDFSDAPDGVDENRPHWHREGSFYEESDAALQYYPVYLLGGLLGNRLLCNDLSAAQRYLFRRGWHPAGSGRPVLLYDSAPACRLCRPVEGRCAYKADSAAVAALLRLPAGADGAWTSNHCCSRGLCPWCLVQRCSSAAAQCAECGL